MTTASTAGSPAFRDNRFFQWICLGVFVVIAINAYHPERVFDFALENGCVSVVLLLILGSYRWMPFSDLSYLLMLIYLGIHEYGAHYKYSDVPIGEWLKPILHTSRNHFDRIAHFSFGFFLAYPMREVALRRLRVTGAWQYYLPVECTLGISAVYEILEAFMASVLTPERGEEFVGMQGDMWDSQEDMFVAGLGSVIGVLLIAAAVEIYRSRRANREIAVSVASSN